jgi:hypothetical protein
MKRLALIGAALAAGLLASMSTAYADGGPANYRFVTSCNNTYGPVDGSGSAVLTFDAHGNLCTSAGAGGGVGGQYPAGATPLTASTTGTTAATAATLAGTVGKTTFVCGFTMTSGGTSAAVVADATVSGTISGTLHFAYVSVSSGQGSFGVAFPLCIPASATNTSIVVTEPAGGTGTVSAVTAWGYQL